MPNCCKKSYVQENGKRKNTGLLLNITKLGGFQFFSLIKSPDASMLRPNWGIWCSYAKSASPRRSQPRPRCAKGKNIHWILWFPLTKLPFIGSVPQWKKSCSNWNCWSGRKEQLSSDWPAPAACGCCSAGPKGGQRMERPPSGPRFWTSNWQDSSYSVRKVAFSRAGSKAVMAGTRSMGDCFGLTLALIGGMDCRSDCFPPNRFHLQNLAQRVQLLAALAQHGHQILTGLCGPLVGLLQNGADLRHCLGLDLLQFGLQLSKEGHCFTNIILELMHRKLCK